ncbi:MAG: hypothetical protein P4M13_07185 [Alphaproteobacteria bacterium]|nr:hypothetical protein [Alphaproteobacteria bacterium]
MSETEKDQGKFVTWMANNSGKAIVRLGVPIFAVTSIVTSFALKFAGINPAWGLGGGAFAFGVAYKCLSKPVVENFDDPYNNVFVTSAKRDPRDTSRIVVSGVILVPRANKKPVVFCRQFSIASIELAATGIKLEKIGNNSGVPIQLLYPTYLISMNARGRYVNLGIPNHTFMMPTVVKITAARQLVESDREWYENQLKKAGGKIVSRTVLTMGEFGNTLAPHP